MGKRDYYLKSPFAESQRNLNEICARIAALEKPTVQDFLGLFQLLKQYKQLRSVWPGNVLFCRIQALAEAPQDSDLGEFVLLLKHVLSAEPNAIKLLAGEAWWGLDYPVPEITFSGKVFCFICSFAFGSKEKCKEAVSYLGGGWVSHVDETTDYLIVGAKAREDFECYHNNYKNLDAAKQLKSQGGKCKIVLEEFWIRNLPTDRDFREKISGSSNYAGPALSFSITLDSDGNVETNVNTDRPWRPDGQK